jgi:hypothetical protein
MPKKRREPRFYERVEYEHEGTVYQGRFYVEDRWLYVEADLGSKNAALHQSNPLGLARILMSEIVREHPPRKPTAL